MTQTLVLVRINGSLWWPVQVWAKDMRAAQVCARLHIEAVTGERVVDY